MTQLKSLLPNYQIKWRAAQKPAKTSYAGTMYRNGLHPKIIRPAIDKRGLDNEGRLLILEFDNYFVVNAYIPHYECHLLRNKPAMVENSPKKATFVQAAQSV